MGFFNSFGAALSGAGKAGTQALADISRFTAADMLEQRRNEMDMQKQQKLLEAQRAMHTETINATSTQRDLDRQSAQQIAREGNQTHKDIAHEGNVTSTTNVETQVEAQKGIADLNAKTTKEVHKEDRLSAKEIATLNSNTQKDIAAGNRTSSENIAKIQVEGQKSIHAADRLLKKYEIDTTADASSRIASSKAINEVGNEITRLNALLANPMLDPPVAKTLKERLGRLEGIHDAYSRVLLPPGERAAASAAPKKNLPPFQFPKGFNPSPAPATRTGPGPLNAPGIKVLPVPSAGEQEMMKRALNP